MNIVIINGTNRAGSLSRMLAKQLETNYQASGHAVDLLDMAELPPEALAPDAYKQPAENITSLVDRFLAADGVHFIVPEYNGSFPGVVKLFIDLLPYPAGFDQRPCAFTGLAAGQFSALRAVEALQAVAGYRNAYQFPRRVFIANSYQQFDFESGALKDEDLAKRLQTQAEGFLAFIEEVGGKQIRQRSAD